MVSRLFRLTDRSFKGHPIWVALVFFSIHVTLDIMYAE